MSTSLHFGQRLDLGASAIEMETLTACSIRRVLSDSCPLNSERRGGSQVVQDGLMPDEDDSHSEVPEEEELAEGIQRVIVKSILTRKKLAKPIVVLRNTEVSEDDPAS